MNEDIATGSSLKRKARLGWAASALTAGLCLNALSASAVVVPNGSFESPTTPQGFPAFPQVDLWQKPAQPAWFDPKVTGIEWSQLAGVFPNTPVGSADHIDNVEGKQAAYFIALPQVSLFQEVGASYEVGQAYNLSIGILGGGGITAGSSFEISLYFKDAGNSSVTVASKSIVFSGELFPNATHLLTYDLNLGPVRATDAWAGKAIGVQLTSTFGTGVGYWDVDNVKLEAVPEPAVTTLLLGGIGALVTARWRRGRRS